MVVSSYLVLQWFHLALLDRVGGMFFLGGFICGCVNPGMITWQPISFGGVRFLDDRCGSLFFEGFIVTDDAGYPSFGHLWQGFAFTDLPGICRHHKKAARLQLQSVYMRFCGDRPSKRAAG